MWVFGDSDHIPENNRNSTEMNWKIKNLENVMSIIKEKNNSTADSLVPETWLFK